MSAEPVQRQPIHLVIPDRGQTDAILAAVAEVIEARRPAIEADPSLGTITLLIRLDRGPDPKVIWRTESPPPR